MNAARPEPPDPAAVAALLDRALAEDVGSGDLTVDAILSGPVTGRAVIRAKQDGVVAGLDVAAEAFRRRDPDVRVVKEAEDGDRVDAGRALLRISGDLRGILTAERTALNVIQRLSGIATLTARYVEAVAGTGVRILDTRKTAPGLRALDKYAVRCGGGENHRRSLAHQVLLKENHVAAAREAGLHPFEAVVRRLVANVPPGTFVGVEVENLGELHRALECDSDLILLDELSLDDLRRAVEMRDGRPDDRRPELEASGGVTLDTVAEIAATGVDRISIGALTHSAVAFDASLEVLRE